MATTRKVQVFDSTLRDGAQAQGISFTVEDKLKVVRTLDAIGVDFIEAGNPGSNPKDLEFFQRVADVKLERSLLVAFGSTRRKNVAVEDDSNVQSLVQANTGAVAIFGKSWDFHATDIIGATLDQNLDMIADTIGYFRKLGKRVVFDAEHFFDGYKANKAYALSSLAAAAGAGAECLALCDTNGGCFPDEVASIVAEVCAAYPALTVGIHAHNDGGMAVANTVLAVMAGAAQVQGTFIGFGERTGNANLAAAVANLELKRGLRCLPEGKLAGLTATARVIAEIANIALDDWMPYVGNHAFSHKGGMHIDAVQKSPRSFEHVEPESVGNRRSFIMSEVAGKSTILGRIKQVKPDIAKDSPETQRIIDKLKELEHKGYQFESADATVELLIRKELGKYKPFFNLIGFKTIGEHPSESGAVCAQALIKIEVGGETEITAAEGDGPINALDKALRKALERFYPELAAMHLVDFKVRVLDSKEASAAKVRVLIESADGGASWTTIGVSSDIIEASWFALVDSIEYKLIRDIEGKFKAYL